SAPARGRAERRIRQTAIQEAAIRPKLKAVPATHNRTSHLYQSGADFGALVRGNCTVLPELGMSRCCATAANVRKTTPALVDISAGTCRAGSTNVSGGKTRTEARAAVQTKLRTAADRLRSRADANHAVASTMVLFNAAPIRSEYHPFHPDIYVPSRFAFSIISAIRSSSSRVRCFEETSRSAAITCSGELLKNVSNRCFTADRLALSRPNTGTYTYFNPSARCLTCPFCSRIRNIARTAE